MSRYVMFVILFASVTGMVSIHTDTLIKSRQTSTVDPAPTGKLVDIGGQHLHVNCIGSGSPTVLLESGTGDVSVIWALVQPDVGKFTRVCSYDRGGYAWSEPGREPRTFAQLSLELRTALSVLHVESPYILVGQSYGGLLVRGFQAKYPKDVKGMVLVDAVHEDQHIVYGGQPHLIRDSATGRQFPQPSIQLNRGLIAAAEKAPAMPESDPIEPPLDRLPDDSKAIWRWAMKRPLLMVSQQSELDWSPEEFARMHHEREANRATLGSIPLIVLVRTNGGYPNGMSISAEDLEKERRNLADDLGKLSTRGKVIYAKKSGHNIHLEDPALVIGAIRDVVEMTKATRVQATRSTK